MTTRSRKGRCSTSDPKCSSESVTTGAKQSAQHQLILIHHTGAQSPGRERNTQLFKMLEGHIDRRPFGRVVLNHLTNYRLEKIKTLAFLQSR